VSKPSATRGLACVLSLLFLFASDLRAESPGLAGLWKAKKRFGPDVRGTLVITRRDGNYSADIAGRVVSVMNTKGELTFALPAHAGWFRGKLTAKDTIDGHWYRPETPVNMGQHGAPVGASRVELQRDGENRWIGIVDPVDDAYTFYLQLQSQSDGSFHAFLGNPERDMGTQLGVERLTRDGSSLTLLGKRRDAEQTVAKGSYDAESDVITLSFPGRGGSYDFARDSDDSEFYPRGKNPGRYVYRAPLAFDDGWPVSTLGAEGIDRATMEKFVQRILDTPMGTPDAPQNHGVLIARHGKLVLEEYFHGMDRDRLHTTRSASKSLTSVVVGAGLQAGVPLKLASPVYEVMNGGSFPTGLDPQKKTMTLEHLLTMSSGYFCDDTNDEAPGNEDGMWDQTAEPDFYRFTMNVPLATPPGQNSVYCSASPNLALGMLGRAAGEDPMTLFDLLVGDPMKIRRYEWGLDYVGHPYGGGSVNLRLRDFMKFGQLMLNGGTWEGHRILSADYAKAATSPQYHLRNIYYGYLWWIEDYPYKDRTVRTFSARGAGGQSVTVIPELDLIVGTFAGNFSNRKGMFAASTDPIPNIILPAVREPGDDKSAPIVERQYVTPYGASKDGSRVVKDH
jgi:CubicO group peptidase (beta-lactamase class C family)